MEAIKIIEHLANYLEDHYVSEMSPQIIYLTKETYESLDKSFKEQEYTTSIRFDPGHHKYSEDYNKLIRTTISYGGYMFAIIIGDENSLLWDAIVAKHNVAPK